MTVRLLVCALFVAAFFYSSAQAGTPPATSAEARNVSGLETGDAGQNFDRPPPGTGETTGTVPQTSGAPSGRPSGLAVVATLVVAALFCLIVVYTHQQSVNKHDARR